MSLSGSTNCEISRILWVGVRNVQRIKQMYSTFRNIQPKKHPGVWCEVIDMHQLHSYEISGTPFQMKTAVWWAWRNNTIDIRQWRHVVLMDKYRFLVDGRRQVRPLWDEYFRDNCIKSTVSVWGESVVIWGGIYYNGNSRRTKPYSSIIVAVFWQSFHHTRWQHPSTQTKINNTLSRLPWPEYHRLHKWPHG